MQIHSLFERRPLCDTHSPNTYYIDWWSVLISSKRAIKCRDVPCFAAFMRTLFKSWLKKVSFWFILPLWINSKTIFLNWKKNYNSVLFCKLEPILVRVRTCTQLYKTKEQFPRVKKFYSSDSCFEDMLDECLLSSFWCKKVKFFIKLPVSPPIFATAERRNIK